MDSISVSYGWGLDDWFIVLYFGDEMLFFFVIFKFDRVICSCNIECNFFWFFLIDIFFFL